MQTIDRRLVSYWRTAFSRPKASNYVIGPLLPKLFPFKPLLLHFMLLFACLLCIIWHSWPCYYLSLHQPFLPGFVQICFFPSCYFAAWVEWWRQIDDWWFSFSANCHFFMFTPYTEQFSDSLAMVYTCLVLHKKTLRTITEDQDRIILLNVCVQKIVHISVTLHCSPSLP